MNRLTFILEVNIIYAKRNMDFIKRNIFYLSIGLYLPFYLVASLRRKRKLTPVIKAYIDGFLYKKC